MLRSLVGFACLLIASSALAQVDDDLPPAPPPAEEGAPPEPASDADAMRMPAPDREPEPVERASAGARTHDGFYLRLAAGFGAVDDTLTASIPFGSARLEVDGKAYGGSFASQLAIAGEIATGLFLGGAIMNETVVTPEVDFDGYMVSGVEVGTLGMLGVMIDWYPDAHGGFHFGGVVAGATINTTDEDGNVPDADDRPAGGAIVLTVGYDFWVSSEWSLGVLGRLTGATLHGDVTHQLAAASLLFSVLYN